MDKFNNFIQSKPEGYDLEQWTKCSRTVLAKNRYLTLSKVIQEYNQEDPLNFTEEERYQVLSDGCCNQPEHIINIVKQLDDIRIIDKLLN